MALSLYTIDRFTMGGVKHRGVTTSAKLNHTIRNVRGLEVEKLKIGKVPVLKSTRNLVRKKA